MDQKEPGAKRTTQPEKNTVQINSSRATQDRQEAQDSTFTKEDRKINRNLR